MTGVYDVGIEWKCNVNRGGVMKEEEEEEEEGEGATANSLLLFPLKDTCL